MPYVLEKISADDIQKIFRDLSHDDYSRRRLQIRGGHFNNHPDLKWAIDRKSNSYLFKAPTVMMSREYAYYFFIKEVCTILLSINHLAQSSILKIPWIERRANKKDWKWP